MKLGTLRRMRGRASAVALGLVVGMSGLVAPAVTTSASAAVNVTVGEGVVVPQGAALKVAMMYGYFKQEGLNVTVVQVPGGGSVAVAALAAGSINFASSTFASALQSNTAGLNIQSIAETENGAPQIYFVVAANVAAALGISKATPWQTVLQKMHNQTVGVPSVHGGDGIYTLAALQAAGLPSNWLTLVTVAQSSQPAAIATTQVGAVVTTFPQDEQIVSGHTGLIAFDMSVLPGIKKLFNTNIITTSAYANSNPTIVKKIAKGIAWADNLLADPATQHYVLKVESYCFSGYTNKILFGQINTGLVKNGYMAPSVANASAAWYFSHGLLTSSQTQTQIDAAYTNKYLPKASVPTTMTPRKDWNFNFANC